MKRTHLALATLAGLAVTAPQRSLRQETPSASRPFIGQDSLSSICLPGQFEDCMGTKMYCESKAWERVDEPKQYESVEACLAERLSQPANNTTMVQPDTAASRQCVAKFFTGGIDDDGNDEVISAPAVPCSEYWERLCKVDRDHDIEDACGQCEQQCKGI